MSTNHLGANQTNRLGDLLKEKLDNIHNEEKETMFVKSKNYLNYIEVVINNPTTYDINPALHRAIYVLYKHDEKIEAIKLLRYMMSLSMTEAKAICDKIGGSFVYA